MKRLPPSHRRLIAAGIAVGIGFVLVWFVAVRPRQKLRQQLATENQNLVNDLNKRNLPSQPEKLRNLQKNQAEELEKLRQR